MKISSFHDYESLTEFPTFSRDFYREPTPKISRALLGHFLFRRTPDGICGGEIVETEAYLHDDPACHAYLRQTPRNATMWGEAGRAYVFRIYGAYHCVNPVCQEIGVAEAVLIRAIRPRFGAEILRTNRPVSREKDLCNGPGKLCMAMQIDRVLDGTDLCDKSGALWIARNPPRRFLRAIRPECGLHTHRPHPRRRIAVALLFAKRAERFQTRQSQRNQRTRKRVLTLLSASTCRLSVWASVWVLQHKAFWGRTLE